LCKDGALIAAYGFVEYAEACTDCPKHGNVDDDKEAEE